MEASIDISRGMIGNHKLQLHPELEKGKVKTGGCVGGFSEKLLRPGKGR